MSESRALTDEDVVDIRVEFAAGARQVDLAERYGVAQNNISSIVTGRTRRKAGGPIRVASKRKLLVDDVLAIRRAAEEGATFEDLAREHGVTNSMIGHIVNGTAYADVGGPRRRPPRRARPLSVEDVALIRDRLADGDDLAMAAAAFEVSLGTIRNVQAGRTAGTAGLAGVSRADVPLIRARYAAGETQATLGNDYGLTQQAISGIVLGRFWPELGGPIAGPGRRRLTREQVKRIRAAAEAGATVWELADRHDVDDVVIQQVLKMVTYVERDDVEQDPDE